MTYETTYYVPIEEAWLWPIFLNNENVYIWKEDTSGIYFRTHVLTVKMQGKEE